MSVYVENQPVQGCTKKLFPGCVNMGEKNCALLPALGKQNATYSPCFTQPGKSLLLQPCKLGLCIASVSLPFTPHFLKPLPLLMEGKEEWCPLITRSGLWDASRRIQACSKETLLIWISRLYCCLVNWPAPAQPISQNQKFPAEFTQPSFLSFT